MHTANQEIITNPQKKFVVMRKTKKFNKINKK